MGEYANDVLVSTDWLAENIDNPDVRIVEVDEDTEAACDVEIGARLHEIDLGHVKLVPWSEARRQIKRARGGSSKR